MAPALAALPHRHQEPPEHAVILGVLTAIGVTGFGAEAFRIALRTAPSSRRGRSSAIPLAQLVDGSNNLAGWHQAWWIAHVLSFCAFLAIIPGTMLRHMFTSPLNMYLSDRDRPKGAMKPLPDLESTELETFGASTIESFTWKQLMDTDACTMCGRCTSVCPAHATGKPLDPREIVLKTGEVMARTGSPEVSPPIGVDAEIKVEGQLDFRSDPARRGVVLHLLQGLRRDLPGQHRDPRQDPRHAALPHADGVELPNRARHGLPLHGELVESLGHQPDHPSRLGQGSPVEVLEGDALLEPFSHEYLYWVGCAGSFDDKNQKVTQAMSKLMDRAGIDFAILGPAELCTGDPARRSGNEYIFQMLAKQNVETLNGLGVKKIVTQCPHCFNTLMNEYPQLGGHYEVVHHSQFIEWLIDQGKLDVSEATLEERIVYHDSCYLGRHNDVYLAPRNVIGSLKGVQIVEAGRNGTKGMCCGAGGARMWMEEDIGTKVNDERSQELIDTGASRVATACPFCYVMMDDGVKGHGVEEDDVKVADIAMHLIDALEEGERRKAEDDDVRREAIAAESGNAANAD